MRATCFRGSLHDFFAVAEKAQAQDKEDPPTIVVGFNTGFGNTNRKLTREWLPSLLEVNNARVSFLALCVLSGAAAGPSEKFDFRAPPRPVKAKVRARVISTVALTLVMVRVILREVP